MAARVPLYLVPLDGSRPSERALDAAIALAAKTGAALLLVHVVNWSGFKPLTSGEIADKPLDKAGEERFTREKILAPAAKKAAGNGVKSKGYIGWGHPARAVLRLADKTGAGMVVMGRRGLSRIAELMMGSVANAVVHAARVPVLIVP